MLNNQLNQRKIVPNAIILINPSTPNDLKRRRAVSHLKI
jgi:hypothetical protein